MGMEVWDEIFPGLSSLHILLHHPADIKQTADLWERLTA